MFTDAEMVIDFPVVRQYLRSSHPTTGVDIITDSVRGLELGATTLLTMCLNVRGNRRTRRSPRHIAVEWQRLRRNHREIPARWYSRVADSLMSLFRVLRTLLFPCCLVFHTVGCSIICHDSHDVSWVQQEQCKYHSPHCKGGPTPFPVPFWSQCVVQMLSCG